MIAPGDSLWPAFEPLFATPAIAVNRRGDAVTINPVTLREEDDGLVVSRLGTLLL